MASGKANERELAQVIVHSDGGAAARGGGLRPTTHRTSGHGTTQHNRTEDRRVRGRRERHALSAH